MAIINPDNTPPAQAMYTVNMKRLWVWFIFSVLWILWAKGWL